MAQQDAPQLKIEGLRALGPWRAALRARLSWGSSGAPVALQGGRIEWLAAAPPERRASFAGSCLPFPSEAVALQGTPNRGTAQLDPDGGFSVPSLLLPNSYYVGAGTVLVPPALHVVGVAADGGGRVVASAKLPDSAAVPFRTLTYPAARTGPGFYVDPDTRVRSQQDLLQRRAYPHPAAVFPA